MAPLRRLRSCFFDDGPRSEIREGDLANIRRKYFIHPSVGMRSSTEFECAPDGGTGEVTIYEAYLEAGFRGVIPSLIDEVSSFFGLCPSQLTPLTWRTLMAIQVLGELHVFSIGVHEILYCYYFAPLANKDGFYHLRFRDGAPLVEEPSRGVRGNVTRSLASVVFDEYHKVKARKRRLSYTPPPRLARAALSAGGLSSISSTSAEIMPNRDLLADAYRRLTNEALLLRGQVQDMMACRDLLIRQVRASARWELMKELPEKRVDHWNPEEEYRRHLFLSGGFDHRSEDLSQAATLRFVIVARFSEGPSF
uniref:Uncharacterized protein n=1 Tax=Brassica oleracea var. oleracea TaxID=109376 RepID=A0A0D3CTF4_BRAOL